MKKLIIILCILLSFVPSSQCEYVTPQEFARQHGAVVVQDGESPGWNSCVYTESDDWLVIMFSNGPHAYCISESTDDLAYYRRLFFELVRNFEWEVSICDNVETELFDLSYGIVNDIDKTRTNHSNFDTYLVELRDFLNIEVSSEAPEFLFRNIAWDTSISDFREIVASDVCPSYMHENDFSYANSVRETTYVDLYNPDEYLFYDSMSSENHGFVCYKMMLLSDGTLPVAGYYDYRIEAYAIPSLQNGKICDSPDDCNVINAKYVISYEGSQPGHEIYEDILRKLISLYGDYDKYVFSDRVSANLWFGSNDTYLNLSHTKFTTGGGNVHIEYGDSNSLDVFSNLVSFSMQKIDASNTDGL